MNLRIEVLDHGYVEIIEAWGSDERIIEAARMSTGKEFKGWGEEPCSECGGSGHGPDRAYGSEVTQDPCPRCKGEGRLIGDEKLLAYLYKHKHMTPFEMAGLIVEVKAPIFVFREWHRHRTQSYNEMSARYIPLPDENYTPTADRIVSGAAPTGNRQAQGTTPPPDSAMAQAWLFDLEQLYKHAQRVYDDGLRVGIPKELARLPVPVARYSRMRASANLRNWLQFLDLRLAPQAQKEIRLYAEAVAQLVRQNFPRTMDLYVGEHI